jgi:hypothetical protein
MTTAVIFSVPCIPDPGFAWRWRAQDNSEECRDAFRYYADCVADAKRKGFTVELGRIEAFAPRGRKADLARANET